MAKRQPTPLTNLEAYRRSRGESQTQFWTRFGVTQSGGSRYESGRAMPLPTAMLVLAFADGVVDDDMLVSLRKKVSANLNKKGVN